MEHNDQEQLQKLLLWLRKNALVISAVLVIGGGGSASWHLWKSFQHNSKAADSLTFEQIQQLSNDGNLDQSLQKLTSLQQSDKTSYSVIASLVFAQKAYLNDQPQLAIEHLQWIIDNSDDEISLQLATNRLARLLIDQKQPDKAISVIQGVIGRLTNPSALGTLYMIIGDSYLYKKQYLSAVDFYNTAKKNLPEESALKELIEFKTELAQSL